MKRNDGPNQNQEKILEILGVPYSTTTIISKKKRFDFLGYFL